MANKRAEELLAELITIMMFRGQLPAARGKALEIIERYMGKKNIYVCPKCEGDKLEYDAVPSPRIGGGNYYPPCGVCDGKGYITE